MADDAGATRDTHMEALKETFPAKYHKKRKAKKVVKADKEKNDGNK